MDLYVAGKFERVDQMICAVRELRASGHWITFDWTNAPSWTEAAWARPSLRPDQYLAEQAINDLRGVALADAVVFIYLSPNMRYSGAWAEVGAALGQGKPVYLAGWTLPEDVKPREVENWWPLFLFHPNVRPVDEICPALGGLARTWARNESA